MVDLGSLGEEVHPSPWVLVQKERMIEGVKCERWDEFGSLVGVGVPRSWILRSVWPFVWGW